MSGDLYMDAMPRCPDCGADRWAGSPHTCPPKITVFDDLMAAHLARNELWQGGRDKGPLYSILELAGEVGELCNVAKKLERERIGMAGSKVSPQDFEDELGDVIICAFIVAAERGIDPMKAAAKKFNKTSRKLGFPVEMKED